MLNCHFGLPVQLLIIMMEKKILRAITLPVPNSLKNKPLFDFLEPNEFSIDFKMEKFWTGFTFLCK